MAKSKSSGKTKTKFDFQQFLLVKGEKIALIVAGVGLALLALFGIMAASHAESPSGLASKLRAGATKIDSQLIEVPGQAPDKIELPEGVTYRVVRVDEFKTPNDWFSTAGTIVEKRVNPVILAAKEGRVSYAIGGIPVYVIQGDNIAIIENRTQAKNNAGAIDRFKKGRKGGNQPQAKATAPQPPTPPPPPVAGVPGPPGASKSGGRGGSAPTAPGRTGEPEIVFMKDDDPKLNNAELARNLLPMRMAVVEGVVPYKDQVERYLRALRLDSDAALEADGSAPIYRGLIVERQIVPPDGTTDPNKWEPFDHVAAVGDLYRITAEFVGEDPRYEVFIPEPVHKLYLRRPKFARGGYAPSELVELGKALQEIEKTGAAPKDLTGKQKQIKGQEDPFNIQDSPKTVTPAPGVGGIPSDARPGGPIPPNRAGPPRGPGMTTQPRNTASPVWKFQFIDPTIEPGLCYRYRVKFKALNPNFGSNRKDQVAIPSAATTEELVSDWFEIPGFVFAPPEEHLYAHGDNHKDRSRIGDGAYDTTVLRFHRWFEEIRGSSARDFVAEWVCADIEAKRGQYIQQNKGLKLPLWSMVYGAYIFREQSQANRPKTFRHLMQRENVRVDLMPTVPTLLVDFEGGSGSYRRPNGENVQDNSVAEILLQTDDGKTMAVTCRNTVADSKETNAERKARENAWEEWLREVENASRNAGGPATGAPPGPGAPGG